MTSAKSVIGVLIAGSMLVSSPASAAAAILPTSQINPWAALSAMTAGAPAVAMCGAAATAAQPAGGCVLPALDAPPPMAQPGQALPPVAAPTAFAATGASTLPLLLALAALVAAAGIYGLSKASGDIGPLPPPPNSPA